MQRPNDSDLHRWNWTPRTGSECTGANYVYVRLARTSASGSHGLQAPSENLGFRHWHAPSGQGIRQHSGHVHGGGSWDDSRRTLRWIEAPED